MIHGPSPLIPLLLVSTLGCFTLGPQLLEKWSSVIEFQEAWYAPLIITSIVAFLFIFLVSEIVLVPAVIVLVAALFKAMVIAPLILLLLAAVFFTVVASNKNRAFLNDGGSWKNDRKDDGEGSFGLGAFMLVMMFLLLSSLFCEGECYWWISLMLVLPFVYFFSAS